MRLCVCASNGEASKSSIDRLSTLICTSFTSRENRKWLSITATRPGNLKGCVCGVVDCIERECGSALCEPLCWLCCARFIEISQSRRNQRQCGICSVLSAATDLSILNASYLTLDLVSRSQSSFDVKLKIAAASLSSITVISLFSPLRCFLLSSTLTRLSRSLSVPVGCICKVQELQVLLEFASVPYSKAAVIIT